jgi:hypothetical protein
MAPIHRCLKDRKLLTSEARNTNADGRHFVPWRFSAAGRRSAWLGRHPGGRKPAQNRKSYLFATGDRVAKSLSSATPLDSVCVVPRSVHGVAETLILCDVSGMALLSHIPFPIIFDGQFDRAKQHAAHPQSHRR